MQIYGYGTTVFMAKKNITKFCKTKVENHDAFIKQNNDIFYKNIEQFLKKEINKDEYFKSLLDGIKNKTFIPKNKIEAKYLNDMLTTLDLSGKIKDIPDEYMIKNMQNLLKYKNL